MALLGGGRESQYQPLPFDGANPSIPAFAPDPRLDLQLTGTIEILFYLDLASSGDLVRTDPFCLLANADAAKVNWAVLIDAGGATIGLATQEHSASFPFPFHDGLPHHVALATYGKVTEVIVDGVTLGFLDIGYAGIPDLPLTIGSLNERLVFRGLIHGVRIWNMPLTASDVGAAQVYGRPPDTHPAIRSLVAFSEFTAAGSALSYVAPTPVRTTAAGVGSGKPFRAIVPGAGRLAEVRVHSSEAGITGLELVVAGADGTRSTLAELAAARQSAERAVIPKVAAHAAIFRGVGDVQRALVRAEERLFEFAAISEAFADLAQDWARHLQFTELYQELNQAEPRLQGIESGIARFSGTDGVPAPGPRPLQLEGLGAAPSPEIRLTLEEFQAAKEELTALATLLRQIRDGALPLPPLPPVSPVPAPAGTMSLLTIGPDVAIVGIAGTYDTHLRTLRLITNKGVLGQVGTPGATGLARAFVLRLPAGAAFAGVHGLVEGALARLGMFYYEGALPASLPWQNTDLAAPALNLGLWQDVTTRPPERDDQGIRRLLAGPNGVDKKRAEIFVDDENKLHLHGNYQVYSVAPSGEAEIAMLHRLWLTPSFELLLAREDQRAPLRLTHQGGSIFFESGGTRQLVFDAEGASFTWDGRRYRRPKPYAEHTDRDTEILPWGGTFSADQRPTLVEFNFRGYHIGRINHRNYQLGTGAACYVFRWPDDSSRDYTITTTGKILPHGIHYCADQQAIEKAHAVTAKSSQEHHRAWNVNLGLSIGVPEAASFGMNFSYQEELGTIVEKETMYSLTFAKEVEYALVCDRARVQLDPEFRSAVLQLRDRHLTGLPVSYKEMLEMFGTHYPFAVTYGGAAYQELTYTTEALIEMASKGFEVSAHASGTLEGVTIGANAGGGMKWSSKLAEERKVQDSSFRTIGGSYSFNGGWTLGHRSEVPLFLDLRPLPELLSPVFFDDPVVWTTLRDGLRAEIDSLPKLQLDKSFSLRFFEVSLAAIRNDNKVLAGGTDVSIAFGAFLEGMKQQLEFLGDIDIEALLGGLLEVADALLPSLAGLIGGVAIRDILRATSGALGVNKLHELIPLISGRTSLAGSIRAELPAGASVVGSTTLFEKSAADPLTLRHGQVHRFSPKPGSFVVAVKASGAEQPGLDVPVTASCQNTLLPRGSINSTQTTRLDRTSDVLEFTQVVGPADGAVRVIQGFTVQIESKELESP